MGYGKKSNSTIRIDNKDIQDKIGDLSGLQTTDKTSLVSAVNEHTTQLAEIATNVKSNFGSKGNGTNDDTIPLSNALNSSSLNLLLPDGTYLLTDTITVNSSGVKTLQGSKNTILKVNLSSSKTLFNLLSNVIFKDLILDFSNSYCQYAFLYAQNLGTIKLQNIQFQNMKDIDSTKATNLISIPAQGNGIDIDRISFNNILKRGNGVITDANGSMNAILYGGDTLSSSSAIGGTIKNVTFSEFHNIDTSNNIILEDTAGVYLALAGKISNTKIYDVDGYNFGKRLLKIQASSTSVDKVKGESHTGDALSVVGVLSEAGVFSSDNASISKVFASGWITHPIASYATNSVIDNCDIISDNSDYFGIYLFGGANNTTIKNCRVSANRPIVLDLVQNDIKDITIKDCELTLFNGSKEAVNFPGNPTKSFDGLTLRNVKVVMPTNPTGFITVLNTFNNLNKNLTLENVKVIAQDNISGTYTFTNFLNLNGIDGIYINNVSYESLGTTVLNSDSITISDCKNIDLSNIKSTVPANRTVLLQRNNVVKVRQNKLLSTANTGHFVFVSCTKVEIEPSNEQFKILYGTQDATEIMRNNGTTAQRPKFAYKGFRYLDITLNKDIIVKTAAVLDGAGAVTTPAVWMDALGTVV